MRKAQRKARSGSGTQRRTEYRILLFKDVEQVPVQLRLTFTKIRLAVVAGIITVFTVLILAAGFALNARLYRESETVRHQQVNSRDQSMQQLIIENEALKESLRVKDEQLGEQQQEVQELHELARTTSQKLEDIQQREQEVRSRLGLEEEPQEDTMAAEQAESFIVPHTIPTIRQSYLSLQQQLDSELSVYTNFDEVITKNEQAVKKAAARRDSVVSYALQFVGGKYVYGGNDPNKGVDCSGFTKYVLSHAAGVSLNRTAARQSEQGTTVTMDQARPGDLVFYANSNSHINHVALYIGNGKVVHASSSKTGIIVSRWDYRTPAKIKNVLGS